MDQDGSSPHSVIGRPSFLHGTTSPSYLPGHTPPHGHEHFSPYPDHLSVYTSLSKLNIVNLQIAIYVSEKIIQLGRPNFRINTKYNLEN